MLPLCDISVDVYLGNISLGDIYVGDSCGSTVVMCYSVFTLMIST